jgi:hypothetical protein
LPNRGPNTDHFIAWCHYIAHFGVRLGAVSPDNLLDLCDNFVLRFEPQGHRRV